MASYLDTPLDQYLRGDTHVRITCTSIGGKCRRSVVVLARDLVAKAPDAFTVGDLKRRMRCTKCHSRGWCHIEPAGRG